MALKWKSLKQGLLSVVPVNYWLYRLCKGYVDFFNGENNCDIETNGELRYMKRVLPKCSTVFDIGANVGHWAALALRINQSLQLHCFEPGKVTYRKLLQNSFPANVICNNFGMSSEPGEAPLFIFEDGAGINSLYKREGLESFGLSKQENYELVRLDTVDDYCKQKGIDSIDLLKIDVEGHELEVFRGTAQMLFQGRVKVIQFEYGGCNIDAGVLLKDIFNFFSDYNYNFYKICSRELRLVARYDQCLENFQHQNWLIVDSGHFLLD